MSTFLDLEHLQQQSYERSKNWATFLENIAHMENYEEIDINDLENIIEPHFDEHDSDDDLASMEDGECNEFSINLDVLRNVAANTTDFSILLNSNKTTLPADATDDSDENHKLIDLFNQTLPIINEHNRHLKESGFDKILNTFDKHKIEETVGSWLNRHNTLYGGDATLISPKRNGKQYPKSCYGKNLEHQYKTTAYRNYHRQMNDSNDSDDSLQSGETARYIRSSRASAMRNASSSSTTTMIKTYRMVKSKREALREKYACDKDDDETHLKAIRYRRRVANTEHDYHHHNHYEHGGRLQRSHKHQMYATPSTCSQKRRLLRKRTISNSCTNTDYSSTDSDSYYYDIRHNKLPCCSQHHYTAAHHNKYVTPLLSQPNTVQRSHRSAMKMPSSRSSRFYYYSHSLSKSVSSSSLSSSTSFTNKRRPINRNCRFYNDKRPCKLESECRCCNDRKLCQDYKHVTDTSTEEWYVENCHSPKKRLKNESYTQPKSHKSKTTSTESLPPLNENNKDVTKKIIKQKAKITDKSANQEETKKEQLKKKNTLKVNKTENNIIPEDTFDLELQMAIEESKKLYEQEMKTKTTKTRTETKEKSETKEIREIKNAKPLRKTTRTTDDAEDMKEIQINRKRPQTRSIPLTSKDNDIKEKVPKLFDEEEIFVKPQQKSLSKPLNKTKNSTNASTGDTLIVSTQNQLICNSTANKADNQAYKRQFAQTISRQEDIQQLEELLNNFTANNEYNPATKHQPAEVMLQHKLNDEKSIKDKKPIQNTTLNKHKIEKPTTSKIETQEKCEINKKHEKTINKLSKIIDSNDSTNSETEPAFDKDIFIRQQLKSVTKSLHKTKNSTITSTDETLISLKQNLAICKSTAKLNDNQYYNRQFTNSISHEDKTLKPQKVTESKTQRKKNDSKSNETKKTLKLSKIINSENSSNTETEQDFDNDTQRKKNDSKSNKTKKALKFSKIINSENSTITETEQDFDKDTQRKKNDTKSNDTKNTMKMSKIIDSEDSTSTDTEQDHDKDSFVKPQLKSVTKSVNKTKISTITSTDETFFSPIQNHQAICNSTAKPNDTTAYIRQFSNYISHEDKTLKVEKVNESKTQQKKNDTKSNKAQKQKSEPHKKTASNSVVTSANNKLLDNSKAKNKTATSTVTSTTIRSPDTNSTTDKTRKQIAFISLDSSLDEHSDCTLVTSTTNIEHPSNPATKTDETMQQAYQPSTSLSSSLAATQQRQDSSIPILPQNKTLPSNLHHHHHPQTQKGILIYTPQNRSLVPANSFSSNGGYFNITKEHLSSIIGEKATEKFLKYYIGRRRFNSNSTIYFKPPSGGMLDTSSSGSNSDDEFSNFEKYGELYESLNNNSVHHKHS